MDLIVDRVERFVEDYMNRFDASHDYQHVQRVLRTARRIEAEERLRNPECVFDSDIITLASLLHDVGDKKYIAADDNADEMVQTVLLNYGASADLASRVQTIVTHVSYSSETKGPEKVLRMIETFPELAVVQDADRLDAIGAVGIGRTFTFGAVKQPDRGMEGTIEHFTFKLERLEAMMKTATGKEMAAIRTQRLKAFKMWWIEETTFAAAAQ